MAHEILATPKSQTSGPPPEESPGRSDACELTTLPLLEKPCRTGFDLLSFHFRADESRRGR